MNIIFAASEMVPFCKTGGLADVIGGLPAVLSGMGHEVSVFLPGYSQIDRKKFGFEKTGIEIEIHLGDETKTAEVSKTSFKGVNIYILENTEYFSRDGLYGNINGDFADNGNRFVFFSRCIIETIIKTWMKPDIVHCNDWQAALVIPYIKTIYLENAAFSGTSTLFTIHNLGYQGIFPENIFWLTGLPHEAYNWKTMEYWGNLSMLKGGIVYTDAISTVSEGYAKEILSEELGYGLHGVFAEKKDRLYGILNGIDYEEWNPETDKTIPANFSKSSIQGKEICRDILIRETGLELTPDYPLLGMVSRLDEQKGFDILGECVEKIVQLGAGIVILGTGTKKYTDMVAKMADKFPQNIYFKSEFDNIFAHLIYAGTDAFLMPSRYEPCGLGQMIAMRYGSLPVVHSTGGLSDTVEDFNDSEKGTGFSFTSYSPESLFDTVGRAVNTFRSPGSKKKWDEAVKRAMNMDFSWKASAQKYEKLYTSLLK